MNIKLVGIMFLLLIVPSVAFADEGIMVYNHVEDSGILESGKTVNIIKETEWGYTVIDNGNRYQVKRTHMIRTTRSTQLYETIRRTNLLDYDGRYITKVPQGTTMEILRQAYDPMYGEFKFEDGTTGYIRISDTKAVEEPALTEGLVKETTTLNNGEYNHTMYAGSLVSIKNYSDGVYTLYIDGQDYTVGVDKVALIDKGSMQEIVSRGASYRTAQSVDAVVKFAHEQIGKKYVHATAGPYTYDCSGLTTRAYSQIGVKIPRTSLTQSQHGILVSRSELMPGDLVFFKTTSAPVGHVGIYIGEGNFIHAATSTMSVRMNNLSESYYSTRYVNARRVVY